MFIFAHLLLQEHGDLETRIAQIIKGVEATEREASEEAAAVAAAAAAAAAAPTSSKQRKKDSKQAAFQTRPYNDGAGGEEDHVMDDEELHSLLGV